MVTISNIVENLVEQRPFLQEALVRGIVNNAALAEEMQPEIEKLLKKKVKFSAVNMAIRRLGEKLKNSKIYTIKFNKSSDITIRSDLIELTAYKLEDIQTYVKKLYDIVDLRNGDFLTITQGINELMIITNSKYEQKIGSLFPKKLIKSVVKGLSSVTINLPMDSVETRGLFYLVTRSLSWEDINIIDVVSTFTEMTIIINEEDTSRAFETIKELIRKNS